MAQSIHIDTHLPKTEIYKSLYTQIKALLATETDTIANMANFCAVYKDAFKPLWVGFYLVKNNQLVLGPFQGPLACTRINFGKGVCGTAWQQKKSMLVPNVDEFPGHIACSSLSKSEIVVPATNNKHKVTFVLDIDSENLNHFDQTDQIWLEKLVKLI